MELAAALQERRPDDSGPLQVLDVGANVGDSAKQIIARTASRVLCVEADPYWADFLRRNVGADARAAIEEALLTADAGEWSASTPVRSRGTTRFTQDRDQGGSVAALSVRHLRERHPDFTDLRLAKSDTDGFDPVLVPAIAEAWSDRGPVLFFEFDPGLAHAADDRDPFAMWGKLRDLGYARVAIWDNTSDPLGQLDIEEADAESRRTLARRPVEFGYDFWDVAACRADDVDALAVFDELVPEPYDIRGIWRHGRRQAEGHRRA